MVKKRYLETPNPGKFKYRADNISYAPKDRDLFEVVYEA